MFIEKLWQQNPKTVEDMLKRICELRDEKGDKIEHKGLKNGYMHFDVSNEDDDYQFDLYVNDFKISVSTICEEHKATKYDVRWMKFMYKIYGDEYAMQYISHRNKQLDKFMHDYEQKYNKQTVSILAEMGDKKYQDMQNQTK